MDRSLPPTPTPFLHATVPYDYSATPTRPTFVFDSPTDNSHVNHSPYPKPPFAYRDTPSPSGSSLPDRNKSLSWTLNKLAQGSISSLSSIRRSLTPSVLLDTASRPLTPRHSPQNSSGGSKRSRSPRSPSKVYFPTSPTGALGVDDRPSADSSKKLTDASQSVDLSAYEIELDSFDIERDLAPGYHEKDLSPLPTPKTFDSFILPQSVRPSLDSDNKSEKTVKGRRSEGRRSEREERPPRRSGS